MYENKRGKSMKNSTMSNYELLYEIDEHIRQISQIRKIYDVDYD